MGVEETILRIKMEREILLSGFASMSNIGGQLVDGRINKMSEPFTDEAIKEILKDLELEEQNLTF